MTETRLRTQVKAAPTPSFTPVRGGVLQRKSSCGGIPGPRRECEASHEKKLRRRLGDVPALSSIGHSPFSVSEVPPIVHEVLRSPGQPLDVDTRDFFEPRFGHDFSQVRMHTGAQAAESARAVNASAYTVGQDVVFGVGQYTPNSHEGRKLLAHELTHVVQQQGQPYSTGIALGISQPSDPTEVEATRVTEISGRAISTHTSSLQIQRQKAAEFPGYSQGVAITCGAASLVTALMIWDKERKSPTAPNDMVVTACNIILTHMDDHKTALINGWNAQGKKGNDLYNDAFTELTRIRDDARKPGAKIPESDYQLMSTILVILFSNASGGLSKAEIMAVQTKLGLSSAVQSATQAQTFDDLFADPVSTSLKPGQVAQVFWYQQDKQGNPIVNPTHVFLVGRFQRGAWFLSDQGTKPPTELEAATPGGLKIALLLEVQAGRASIFTGAKPMLLPLPFTGVVLLGERGGVEKQAENIILTPGTFIAEVDASVWHGGDRIMAWDFVARAYSLADAKTEMNGAGTGSGGLIVENPVGLFHIFKTSLVSDTNVMETKIDESDSKDGKVTPSFKRYYHAWLQLRSASKTGSFFQVY
jgi:hypothetical protein